MRITIETDSLSDNTLIILRRLIDLEIENQPVLNHERKLVNSHNSICRAMEKRFGINVFDADISKLQRLESTELRLALKVIYKSVKTKEQEI